MSETLFAHLATRFAPSPENIAIEALGFILQRSPAARAAFTGIAGAGGLELPADLSFATQAVAEDDGRPDIEGYGTDLQRYVVAETKFHAGLTQHQPLTYAARLPADRLAALVFIIPAARMPSLWSELIRRLKGGDYVVSTRREMQPELWTASFDSGHHFVLVSWRRFSPLSSGRWRPPARPNGWTISASFRACASAWTAKRSCPCVVKS